MENYMPEISIDKMVIAGYDAGGFQDRVNNDTGYIEKDVYAKFPYRKAWVCRDGSFLQWTDEHDYKDIRLEFNPNKCEKENIIKLLTCMKYGAENRVDIAFDFFGIDLSKHFVFDHETRKYIEYRTGIGDLETRYFGAMQSDLQVVMYDKAKEQEQEGQWWRFEARLTGEWAKTLHGDKKRADGRYKPYMGNPFTGIQINVPSKDLSHLKLRDRMAIEYLLIHPEAMGELPKQARLKYKKILANLKADKDLFLEHHFQKNYSDIMHEIKTWTRYANKQNVI